MERSLENVKIEVKDHGISEEHDFAQFICSKSALCALCSKELAREGKGFSCAILYNKKAQQLACLDNLQRGHLESKSSHVHPFHPWCLQQLILEACYEEDPIVQCPACQGAGKRRVRPRQPIGRLGIDIGGVIISRRIQGNPEEEDTEFDSDNFLTTPAEPHAIKAIAELAAKWFGPSNVFLVSKCGLGFRDKTNDWLEKSGFWKYTNIPRENLHFCENRIDKAPICQKLGITHFVDDQFEVLKHLMDAGDVENLYFYRPESLEKQGHYLYFSPLVQKVESWKEMLHAIDRTKEKLKP